MRSQHQQNSSRNSHALMSQRQPRDHAEESVSTAENDEESISTTENAEESVSTTENDEESVSTTQNFEESVSSTGSVSRPFLAGWQDGQPTGQMLANLLVSCPQLAGSSQPAGQPAR